MIEIYTDGSALDNGATNNCGGFGVCALIPDEKSKSGIRIDKIIYDRTALRLTQTDYIQDQCIIKSDSAYCVNMFNDWIYSWQRNGWVRPKNAEIKNLDLIKQIWEYCTLDFPNFRVEKVKGHSTVIGNIIADYLATNNIEKLVKFLKENDIECPF